MKRQNQDNRGGGSSGGYGNERSDYGGGSNGPNKRYRVDSYAEALANGKFELRLLIPTKTAGAVIGKGGENIKAIREKVIQFFKPFICIGE